MMGETTKRCWVIVEGWERTGPLLGVRDTYEAAVLEATRYVGQRFRVAWSVLDDGSRPHFPADAPVGGTRLEMVYAGSDPMRVGIWAADLRLLGEQTDGGAG